MPLNNTARKHEPLSAAHATAAGFFAFMKDFTRQFERPYQAKGLGR